MSVADIVEGSTRNREPVFATMEDGLKVQIPDDSVGKFIEVSHVALVNKVFDRSTADRLVDSGIPITYLLEHGVKPSQFTKYAANAIVAGLLTQQMQNSPYKSLSN